MGNPADPQGYTSKYIDVDFTPEYPFGFGLSYTTFSYQDLRVSGLTFAATIANTGKLAGDEVVQLYTSGPAGGSVARPVRELKGFQRIHLKPGEKRSVEFKLSRSDLAFYGASGRVTTEPGRYQVWIAPDSVRGVRGEFTLE
jgi:beta-glucosidase